MIFTTNTQTAVHQLLSRKNIFTVTKQAVILHICNAEHKDINIKIIKGVLFGTWNYLLFIYKENK